MSKSKFIAIKKFPMTILIGIVLLSCFSGCGLFPDEEAALAPPLAVPEQITYKTEDASTGYIENSINCTGYLVPIKSENHMFKYSNGRLKKILVSSGSVVKKGDLIAELLIDSLESDIKLQKLTVESIRSDCNNVKQVHEIDLKLARESYKQLEEKYKLMTSISEGYSKKELEAALNDVNSQKASIDKLILSNKSQLEAKQHELEAAQIRLDNLNKQREASKITALIDGLVTYTSLIKEGEFVDAYSTVVTVSDPSEMNLEYKGNEASKFELGMKVEVAIDDKKLSGEVVLTPSSVPSNELEKFKETIRIKLSETPSGLKAGDSADIKLVLESEENALIIPRSAVHIFSGNYIVYVLEDELRVEKYVKMGIESTNMVEIVEGLETGEKVIVE